MATSWCVPCFESSHAHTPATRTHDEDPMCQACAVRLGFEEKAPAATATGSAMKAPAATAAGSAIEAPAKTTKSAEEPATAGEVRVPASPATGFSSEPAASPGSFGHAIRKAFLPKPQPSTNQGETMPKRVQFDHARYRDLEARGLSQKEIAAEMGIGYSTLSYKLKKHSDEAKPNRGRKPNVEKQPDGGVTIEASGALTVALPESALDAFFAKLPAERKIAIFTSELAR
jgi:hypothetical protein